MGTTTIENIGDELVQRGADSTAATDLSLAFDLVKAWIEQCSGNGVSNYRTCQIYHIGGEWVAQLVEYDCSKRDNILYTGSGESLSGAVCCAWIAAVDGIGV